MRFEWAPLAALTVLASGGCGQPEPTGQRQSAIVAGEPAPAPGAVPRFVGFGYTALGPSGDYGQRRQLRAAITEVAAGTFRYGVATCEGDSGGPALLRNGARDELVGVTSSGDAVCGLYG